MENWPRKILETFHAPNLNVTYKARSGNLIGGDLNLTSTQLVGSKVTDTDVSRPDTEILRPVSQVQDIMYVCFR